MRRDGLLAIALFATVFLAGGCSNDDDAASEAPNPAVAQMYADGAAIRQLADYLNNSYASSPTEGLVAVASSNYLVRNGTYTADQCISYFRSQLSYLAGARLSQNFLFNTLTATPNRAIDAVGGVTEGRLYTITVDVQLTTNATTASTLARATVDVTVLPDGTAKTIRKCA